MSTANQPEQDQDFAVIIEQKRKSASIYSRLAGRAVVDLAGLLAQRQTPFNRDRYVYEGVKSMADYSHDVGIKNIVLIDKSARPLWVGLSKYWQRTYPDGPRPGIHFLNPTLFRNIVGGSESPADLGHRLEQAGRVTLEQLKDSKSPLADKLDEPLLIADACLHSGRSTYLVKRVLENAGFSSVHVSVINTTLSSSSPAAPEVYATDNVVAARCFRPTAESTLVQNDNTSIFSAPIEGTYDRQPGLDVRSHIGELVTSRFI